MEKTKQRPVLLLGEALHFDARELDLNRDGQLSSRQYDELLAIRNQFWSLTILVYLFAGLVAVIAILDGIRRQDTVSSRIAILGVIGLITYGIYWLAARHMRQYDDDMAEGSVAALQGRISLDIRDAGNNSARYVIRMAGEEFQVSKDTLLAFKNGDPYALYFTTNTRKILSAESLRND